MSPPPVLAPTGVVAFVSADQSTETDTVDDFGRDLVAVFSAGVGLVLERVMIGEPDQGWNHLMRGLGVERLIIAVFSIGNGRRALLYDVAQAVDDGHEESLAKESSMAKMRATEDARRAALEGMQLMGGAGYAREFGMEYQVRRALAPPIFGGTNEIQREIIAKSLF